MKTVGELIKDLKAYEPDLLVIVDGFEYGYDDVDVTCTKKMERVRTVGGTYPALADKNTLESEKVDHLYIGCSRRYE